MKNAIMVLVTDLNGQFHDLVILCRTVQKQSLLHTGSFSGTLGVFSLQKSYSFSEVQQ